MKEASYNALMTAVLLQAYGGKAIKIFNPTMLGLPDTAHFKDGIISFIEVKMGEPRSVVRNKGILMCRPWDAVNDRRQFEVCRSLSKFATMVYMIYYSHIRYTAVLPMPIMEIFMDSTSLLKEGNHFVKGHGIGVLIRILNIRRKLIYETLHEEYGGEK